ncbi:glycoside hydrolase superfamily [Plectosphaerella plurivora]|uniref:Beta-xylanase n=1 Tax=Plectosphaerella plurivora TaxID=936078 RepID=A0A9P8VJK2_9PEZI|nr:glycoside hydrolase superfamily [Plectosphaerella plurivora]
MKSSVLLALAATGLVAAKPTKKCVGLNGAIQAKGKSHVGTALTLRDEPLETRILENYQDIGAITPENAMKWESTEPSRGVFTFDNGDRHADFAVDNDLSLRCHTLVWHSQLAPWVEAGNFDNATLIDVMRDHIFAVAGHFRGKCRHWDVVNEALEEDGSWRQSVFYRTIGEAYFPLAFKFAAEADPEAKLWYNDYNLEYNGVKTEGTAKLIELVRSYGGRIDGVGLQGHLVSESTPTQGTPTPDQSVLDASLRQFTDLGVDVEYTEVDIRLNTPATPEKLAVQAEAYDRVTRSCMDNERCIGLTLWGISDKYSWIPGVFEGEGAALVWDEEYNKKPAYAAILNAIKDS